MCVQGAWAAYASHAFGPWIAGRARVMHGICSFGMTYAATRLIKWLALRFRCDPSAPREGDRARDRPTRSTAWCSTRAVRAPA
ncbi:hypothetical protein BN2476_1510019 [Paraburkholderia piptadeniae]|uniref:Uncharacterized protein n=1 Tax=Paraburkholderia piptadeniae TaxID=1701573 RepID=A0A1N7SX13_9BURK|nr:hypothetical protein BN2476_1510019 [Paraburkholderia piptadeniae]